MDQKDKAAEILERVRAEVPKEQLDLALARCYEAMKRIGEAQAIFDKMLANAPDDPTMVRTVTEFYLQANLRKTAMKQLQRLIDGEVKGTPVDLVWARYQMAKLLDATGAYADRQKGIELLKQNLVSGKSTFRNEQLLAHLIAKCPGAKNREKALEMFEEMMRERPSLAAEDLAAASKLYMAGGDRSKARDTMQKLLASHGNDPRYVAQYIQVLLQCGDLAGAKSWLKRLKEMAPRSMAVASLESEILIEEGEHTKAMEVLTAILHDAKTQSSNRMLLGRMVSLRLEELAQRLDGDKLADVRKQFIEEAEKTVRRLAEDYPTTKVNLAAFLARHEHFDEALSILEEGKETIDSFQLSKVCGIIIRNHQARSSQREQAEELIQLALKRTDRPDALLMVVADSYTRLTDYAKAEGIYRKAIQENPNHAIAMNNLAVLLAMQDENLDEALRLINKAIEIAGPEPAMLDSRATVYIARGESDKALVDIQAALNDAETPIRLFHLAQIYFNGGRPKSAVAAFTDAEKRGLTPSTVQPLELPIYRKFKSLQEKAKADRDRGGAKNAP